jgi:phosphoheptose isomerase
VEALLAARQAGRRFKVVSLTSNVSNSRNVLNAMELARERGAVTVGLTGFDGGKLKHLCDHGLIVPSHNVQHVEEMHLVVRHALYSAIRDTATSSPSS